MRQWKSSCISKHIRKGKADHSIGITGDSLTSSTSATWSPTSPFSLVPQLQGVLWRRARILKQVEVLQKEVVSLRVQLAALACTSTGQEEVRSWQSCRSSWHWRRMIMTSDWLRASSATSAQAPLANRPAKLSRENHALRGLGPLDPRKSCSLSHSTGPRRRKNGSVSARGLSITLDQICVLTRPVLLSCCS